MTRWKASALHLALSLLILAAIAAVLVWRWYPPALFGMAKADKLLGLIGGIDVVIGPLLTLIVYKQGKKSLRFDLTVIALLQAAALAYGLHQVWSSRPVYLVAAVDRLQLVFANEIDPRDQQAAPASFRRLPWFGPVTAGVRLASDPAKRSQSLDLALAGKDIFEIPANYLPYAAVAGELVQRAPRASDLLAKLTAGDRRQLVRAIERAGRPASEIKIVAIESGRGSAAMLLQADNGALIAPVGFDPWPAFAALEFRENKK